MIAFDKRGAWGAIRTAVLAVGITAVLLALLAGLTGWIAHFLLAGKPENPKPAAAAVQVQPPAPSGLEVHTALCPAGQIAVCASPVHP